MELPLIQNIITYPNRRRRRVFSGPLSSDFAQRIKKEPISDITIGCGLLIYGSIIMCPNIKKPITS